MESHLHSDRQNRVNSEEVLSVWQLLKLIQHGQHYFFLEVQLMQQLLYVKSNIHFLVCVVWQTDKFHAKFVRRVVDRLKLSFVREVLNQKKIVSVCIRVIRAITSRNLLSASLLAVFVFDFWMDRFVEQFLGFKYDFVGKHKCRLIIEQVAESYSPELVKVIVVEEHMAPSKCTISSSSSNLLHIVFNRPWHIVVDNWLNVTFINSHTECNRATQHSCPILDELFLDMWSCIIRLSSVVRSRLYSILVEKLRKLVCCSPLGCEDQDWSEILETGRSEQMQECMSLFAISCDWQLQVQSREIWLRNNVVGIWDVKNWTNLLLSCTSSGSSQTNNSSFVSKFLFNHLMQHQVSRSEVVWPLAGAVDFVNADHWDFSAKFG